MKKGYKVNIEELVNQNNTFRTVLYTGQYSQLVMMSLMPQEDIGVETHENTDQFFRFESGEGKVVINDSEYEVHDGDVVIVPAGSQHNVINTSATEPLKMYTLYSPAHHQDGIVHNTKQEAETDTESFDGQTSE